jgi:glycerophosphoryl diester phosphodiesterase
VVESTLPAFANALELGVSTLELDVQITEDGQAVVTHDRRIDPRKCQDTGLAVPDDPDFPYVGKYVNTLTLRQIRTLDCGSRTLGEFPGQQAAPGARMPLLREVFALVRRYRAHDVKLNVETKVEAGAPAETAPREMVAEAHQAGIKVIPWTVDDEATMNKLLEDGVDGMITDYPDRLRAVLARNGFTLPRGHRPSGA